MAEKQRIGDVPRTCLTCHWAIWPKNFPGHCLNVDVDENLTIFARAENGSCGHDGKYWWPIKDDE